MSLLFYMLSAAAAAAKSLQSCPTLCDPIDRSPPGSPVPGILQVKTLENPRDGGAWWAAVYGVAQSRTRLKWLSSSSSSSKEIEISVLQLQGTEPANNLHVPGNGFSQWASRRAGDSTCPRFEFRFVILRADKPTNPWDFWPMEVWDQKFVLSKIAKFVVISDSRNRNWILLNN